VSELVSCGVKVSFLEDAAPTQVQRPALSVPQAAVISDGEARYVWRVSDGRAERIAVRVGAQRNGQVEILSGISASDQVIADPAVAQLQQNDEVRIRTE
jgi:hypothetical protein